MFFRKYGLYFAWLLASVGVLASLYFSEVRHMEPCHLCWYQRMALFPTALVLGIAAYTGFRGIARYLIWVVGVGLAFALYQVMIQEIPGWNPIELCGAGPSCSEKIYIGLGPITLPMVSAAGFGLIGLLLLGLWIADHRDNDLNV